MLCVVSDQDAVVVNGDCGNGQVHIGNGGAFLLKMGLKAAKNFGRVFVKIKNLQFFDIFLNGFKIFLNFFRLKNPKIELGYSDGRKRNLAIPDLIYFLFDGFVSCRKENIGVCVEKIGHGLFEPRAIQAAVMDIF